MGPEYTPWVPDFADTDEPYQKRTFQYDAFNRVLTVGLDEDYYAWQPTSEPVRIHCQHSKHGNAALLV